MDGVWDLRRFFVAGVKMSTLLLYCLELTCSGFASSYRLGVVKLYSINPRLFSGARFGECIYPKIGIKHCLGGGRKSIGQHICDLEIATQTYELFLSPDPAIEPRRESDLDRS